MMNDQRLLYDRELLLLGPKRDTVLELWEVQRYGSDSYGDIGIPGAMETLFPAGHPWI